MIMIIILELLLLLFSACCVFTLKSRHTSDNTCSALYERNLTTGNMNNQFNISSVDVNMSYVSCTLFNLQLSSITKSSSVSLVSF